MFEYLHKEQPTNVTTIQLIKETQYTSADLQYQICSRFMKVTSEQLYYKELQLIQNTHKFIETVNDTMLSKDISSTQESLNFQPFLLQDQDPFAQPTKSRLLLRKSQSNSSLRRSESGLAEAMREVQKCCSERTSSMLSNLVGEFRRIKEKLASCEKYEKDLKKLQARFAVSEQELLVMRKRVSDLQKQNKMQAEEVLASRKKAKQLTQQVKTNSLSSSRSSDNLRALTGTNGPDRLKKYLQQKQVHIFKKEKEVRSIQDKIQKAIDSVVEEQGCQKCCQLVKRIKQSILKYRGFLDEEAQSAQIFYTNYKKIFS